MKTIEFDVKTYDENIEELSINLYGVAKDELELIEKGIKKLINQIDLRYMCSGDRKLFEHYMEEIMLSVQKNIKHNSKRTLTRNR